MPTSLWGVAFYVFALFPGIAFTFAREGHQPVVRRSAVRETATIVFISTICDAVLALIIAVAATAIQPFRAELVTILGGDLSWPARNPLWAVLAIAAAVSASTLLGYLLGSKWADRNGLRWIWKAQIPRDRSVWSTLFDTAENVAVEVGVQLKSGTWIGGTLYSFDNSPEPDPHRALTLSGTLTVRTSDHPDAIAIDGTDWVVIEAGDIEFMQVAQVASPPATTIE